MIDAFIRRPAMRALAAAVLAGSLSCLGGAPAPGLPGLLARIEWWSGWPMIGVAWAAAIGGVAAWTAHLGAGLAGSGRDDAARAVVLGATVAPALLPGAGVTGLLPAMWLAGSLAVRTERSRDLRVALMFAAAVLAVLVDPRLVPAGAFALIAAARHLLPAASRVSANDNIASPPIRRLSA